MGRLCFLNFFLCIVCKEKKIGNFGRFFGDFSVFDGSGKKNPWKKSTEKISAKNRKNPTFSRKNPIFPEKIRFSPKFGINSILGH